MKLKRVGFFRELVHGDPDGPKLVDAISLPQPQEQYIADYLCHGVLCVGCPMVVSDVLESTAAPIGSPHLFTDGEWVWPGDLPYYVEKYHVALPNEFVQHMRLRNFNMVNAGEIKLTSLEL